MAQYLEKHPELILGKTTLELGAATYVHYTYYRTGFHTFSSQSNPIISVTTIGSISFRYNRYVNF